jgi:flagellar biosynthesis protein FliR
LRVWVLQMTIPLASQTAFVFVLVFARIGSMLMAMPAIGDSLVPARVRLVAAITVSFVMMPVLQSAYGTLPASLTAMLFALFGEILVGAFIGLSARIIMSALSVAGTVIAFQSGLAFAQSFDPAQGVQSALIGSLMSMLAVTMIFALDLHHVILAAVRDSYVLFKPGELLPLGSFAQMAINTVSGSFKIGLQMSAPFLVFGLVFFLGIGILSRLMPQVQIFFVAMPANILLGFILFALLLSTMMMWFFDYFGESMNEFVR